MCPIMDLLVLITSARLHSHVRCYSSSFVLNG
nr:MAG TPA: hypothetical protein [Caudoviricetes sp.]